VKEELIELTTSCGRRVGKAEVEHAREVLELCSGIDRIEIAHTLCEHWGWVGPTGAPQLGACSKLLDKLESRGLLRLPEKKPVNKRKPKPSTTMELSESTKQTLPKQPITCKFSELGPVELELANSKEAVKQWKELVANYHPLGCKRTFGCTLRYFVNSQRGRLGCILMGQAALALGVRDQWIGWSRPERLAHLPWVINNQRLIIFPCVIVPHLASHVLGKLARRVQSDWEVSWGYRPVLMETFVDPAKYRGVVYRAAGWQLLGESVGHGICRPGHQYQTTPKLVFVRPLAPDFREQLVTTDVMKARAPQCEKI
jgi:hypothetical protein